MTIRRLTLISACAAALTTAGCGLSDPYSGDRHPTPPARPAAPPTTAGPQQALARFGRLWVNWRSRTLAQNRRDLAALATGELLPILTDDAKRAAAAESGPGWQSTGTVEGVMMRGGGGALVVTQETAARENGDGQSGYVVYLARVESTSDGWKVAEWQRTS
jgi:hypothetical protein